MDTSGVLRGAALPPSAQKNPLDAFQCLLIPHLRRWRERVLFLSAQSVLASRESTIIITHNGSLRLLSTRAGRRVAGISRCQDVERAEIAGS